MRAEAQEMNLFKGRPIWRRRGFSMGGRRGGERSSSWAAWHGAWRPAKAVLEATAVFARRVEAARRRRRANLGQPCSPE